MLRRRYGLIKEEIAGALAALLESQELVVQNEGSVEEALVVWRSSNADFADCLIGAHNQRSGCRATATFDARAQKLPMFVGVG